jgi:pyruvate dehydrogenase E2 component (dihydrolipoamide acetyltransferase)
VVKDIVLPNLGEGIDLVDVSEVLIKDGDRVELDDPVIVLESDKATMEIPTTESGIITKIYVTSGDQIKPGQPIVEVNVDAAEQSRKQSSKSPTETPDTTSEKAPTPSLKIEKSEMETSEPKPGPSTGKPKPELVTAPASPAVRRFARELGVGLANVKGSGPKGRITKEDVQAFVKDVLIADGKTPETRQVKSSGPVIDFSQWGEIETVALNRIRKITGERMQQSWQNAPQVTQFDKADITELDNFRKSLQAVNDDKSFKITLLPFLMKAVVQVLIEYPDFNSSLGPDGKNVILKKYYHIGVAVDTPGGLMVPIIRDVDKKGILELSVELFEVSARARSRKIKPNELVGGTFTISSLGGISGTYFTPIINPPETAILGISRSPTEPLYSDLGNTFIPRLFLPIALTYDHRVIDGASAARFTKLLTNILSDLSAFEGLKLTELPHGE